MERSIQTEFSFDDDEEELRKQLYYQVLSRYKHQASTQTDKINPSMFTLLIEQNNKVLQDLKEVNSRVSKQVEWCGMFQTSVRDHKTNLEKVVCLQELARGELEKELRIGPYREVPEYSEETQNVDVGSSANCPLPNPTNTTQQPEERRISPTPKEAAEDKPCHDLPPSHITSEITGLEATPHDQGTPKVDSNWTRPEVVEREEFIFEGIAKVYSSRTNGNQCQISIVKSGAGIYSFRAANKNSEYLLSHNLNGDMQISDQLKWNCEIGDVSIKFKTNEENARFKHIFQECVGTKESTDADATGPFQNVNTLGAGQYDHYPSQECQQQESGLEDYSKFVSHDTVVQEESLFEGNAKVYSSETNGKLCQISIVKSVAGTYLFRAMNKGEHLHSHTLNGRMQIENADKVKWYCEIGGQIEEISVKFKTNDECDSFIEVFQECVNLSAEV